MKVIKNILLHLMAAFVAFCVAWSVNAGLYHLNEIFAFSKYEDQPSWGSLQANIAFGATFLLTYLVGLMLFLSEESPET